MIWESLTPRETQVCNLLLRGMNNPEIAKELGISVRTIKARLNFIFLKAGLNQFQGIKRIKLAVLLYQEKTWRLSMKSSQDAYETIPARL